MRVEGLTVALRPRSSWEATDLGFALVRRHAGTIWRSWVLVTLPVFLLLNLAGALLDLVGLAVLVFWWLKPVFDRVPLFILSRAVFGAAPSVAETVRAQASWGWRSMLPWLTWRRLHPARGLVLPVDLLEGLKGPRRSERVRVLQRAASGTSALTTLVAVNMETMLSFSIVALAVMFVPIEFLSVASKAVWEDLLLDMPLWARLLQNLCYWIAMSVIEPFFVGAGFGLYLNRRTQLEAWDVELAFRRLAARLAGTVPLLVLAAGLLLATALPGPLRAAEAETAKETPEQQDKVGGVAAETVEEDTAGAAPDSLQRIFAGEYYEGDAEFRAAVDKAYADPDLSPKTTVTTWERIAPPDPSEPFKPVSPSLQWIQAVGQGMAFVAENILWVLVAVLLVLIVRYHRLWLSWVGDRFERERQPDPLQEHAIALPDRLPDDLPGAVRTLWRQGQQRAALALLYRAAVLRLDERLGTPAPPGATESECLRRARRLGEDAYAGLFARIVRCWQAAAYARRLPSAAELENLLTAWTEARTEARSVAA